jgi:PEP-CTERM motif
LQQKTADKQQKPVKLKAVHKTKKSKNRNHNRKAYIVMKPSQLVILIVSVASGLAMASWSAQAQTVFSDDFLTDSSLASPPWWQLNDSTSSSATLTSGSGLELSSTASGHVEEMFSQFSPSLITLSGAGDYVTLSVNFNIVGSSGQTGALLMGLYNDEGTPGTIDETAANGNGSESGATPAATADDVGYFGMGGFNTGAGTSSKFYSRVASNNELGYYSRMTSGTYTQQLSSSASGNANLADDTDYTLNYTVQNNGSGNTITATILQGATTLDNWSYTDAGVNTSFNELDFGMYNKNASSLDVYMTQVTVTSNVTPVPEPSMFAFAGLGLAGLILRLRRR